MTIRAEDGRGYVAASAGGLQWAPLRAWCWDDGESLVLSTTQQRWLTHSDGLFLTTPVNAGISLVTAGEVLPRQDFRGDTLAARIHWSRPNRATS
jgi:hypothetical protein